MLKIVQGLVLTLLACALTMVQPVTASPFIQLGPHSAPAPPLGRASPDLVLNLDEPSARQRIDTVMSEEGFGPSDADRTPSQISFVRFSKLQEFQRVADCQGPGIGTPKLWIETVILDLHSGAEGVRVQTSGRFQVVLSGLISGQPFKLACHSRGVLEAQIREELSKR